MTREDEVKKRLEAAEKRIKGRCANCSEHPDGLDYSGELISGLPAEDRGEVLHKGKGPFFLYGLSILIIILLGYLQYNVLMEILPGVFPLNKSLAGLFGQEVGAFASYVFWIVLTIFLVHKLRNKVLGTYGCPVCGKFEQLYPWQKSGHIITLEK